MSEATESLGGIESELEKDIPSDDKDNSEDTEVEFAYNTKDNFVGIRCSQN